MKPSSRLFSTSIVALTLALSAACSGSDESATDSHTPDGTAEDTPDSFSDTGSQDLAADQHDELTSDLGQDAQADTYSPDSEQSDQLDEQAQPPEQLPFKVASFNLRTGLAGDGENSWKNRESIVINYLKEEAADLFGVQEALFFQMDAITAALPHYAWTGVGRNNTQFEEYCAVFYDTRRYDLLDSGTFWLSDTPDEPGTKFSDKQGYLRIVTWARLLDTQWGKEIFHFNTHYDLSEEDNITERSSALILQKMAQYAADKPVVLTGDFNEHIGEPCYQILVGELDWEGTTGSLLDPWVELGLPDEGTFHAFKGTTTATTRIDWLLHTDHIVALEAGVNHYNENGFYPSDHFPVWTTFAWPAE